MPGSNPNKGHGMRGDRDLPKLIVRDDGTVVGDDIWRCDIAFRATAVERKPDDQVDDEEKRGEGDGAGQAGAQSYDPDEHAIDFVWSTGASALRRPWGEDPYIEELSMEPGAVRLDRLNNGAPLLNSHRAFDVRDVLGVVIEGTAKVEKGNGLSRVRLSRAPEDEGTIGKVIDGIVRNGSMGYRIHRVEITEPTEEQPLRIVRAVEWEPLEVSLVPIGVDDGAGTRAATSTAPAAPTNGEATMPNKDPKKGGAEADVQGTVDTRDEAADEKVRSTTVLSLCSRHDLPLAFAEKLVASDKGLEGPDGCRQAVIDELARNSDSQAVDGTNRVDGLVCEHEKRGETIRDYLLHRNDPGSVELTEGARRWVGRSLLEMVRADLKARGIQVRGMDKGRLADQALQLRTGSLGGLQGTADFPSLLADVAMKVLRAAYDETPRSFEPFTRRQDLPDFKTANFVTMGAAPRFQKVNEHGEFKRGHVADSSEPMQLSTAGIVMGVTRHVLVNDDLGAFLRYPRAFGASAREWENELVWDLVVSNPEMSDGTPVFHADHGNLIALGAGVTADIATIPALDASRRQMRAQRGLGDRGRLRINPAYLAHPDAQTVAWEQFLGDGYLPNTADEVAPRSMKALRDGLLPEPILDDDSVTKWYLFADPARFDTIFWGYLEGGGEGPQLDSRVGFDRDGIEYRARVDFGAAWIDHRGATLNWGA